MKAIPAMVAKVGSTLVLAKELMMETILQLSTSTRQPDEKSKAYVVKTSCEKNLNSDKREAS